MGRTFLDSTELLTAIRSRGLLPVFIWGRCLVDADDLESFFTMVAQVR
jgi:hypothetical protein